jgi:hypothetical protein
MGRQIILIHFESHQVTRLRTTSKDPGPRVIKKCFFHKNSMQKKMYVQIPIEFRKV